MSKLSDKVQENIYSRIIDATLDKGYSLTDLIDNYTGRLRRLREAYNSTTRYIFHEGGNRSINIISGGEYNGRESRLMVKAWLGVKKDYDL